MYTFPMYITVPTPSPVEILNISVEKRKKMFWTSSPAARNICYLLQNVSLAPSIFHIDRLIVWIAAYPEAL